MHPLRLNSTVLCQRADQNRALSYGWGDYSYRNDNFRSKGGTLTHKNAAAFQYYSTVLSFSPLRDLRQVTNFPESADPDSPPHGQTRKTFYNNSFIMMFRNWAGSIPPTIKHSKTTEVMWLIKHPIAHQCYNRTDPCAQGLFNTLPPAPESTDI